MIKDTSCYKITLEELDLKCIQILNESVKVNTKLNSNFKYNSLDEDERNSLAIINDLFSPKKTNEEIEESNDNINSISIPTETNIKEYGQILQKKRGRKGTQNEKKKIHANDQFDNLLRKIQVHYFNFIIDFCNDALRKEFCKTKDEFKYINYKNKTTINFEYISSLRNLSIKDILKMEISSKYTSYKKTVNEELFNRIESHSQWLDKLFEMNYLELFQYYYNEEKPLSKIVLDEKEIILSPDTKSFNDILKKNENLSKKLIDTAKTVYFKYDNGSKNPFRTKIIFK